MLPTIKTGSRRIVFLFRHRVVKIPKFTSWVGFVFGVLENLHERYWWCSDGHVSDPAQWYADNQSTQHLAKIHWADRFGFCVVMDRARTFRDVPADADEFERCANLLLARYKGQAFTRDIKPSNIGVLPNGHVVVVDYGFFEGGCSTYIGRKVVANRRKTLFQTVKGLHRHEPIESVAENADADQ